MSELMHCVPIDSDISSQSLYLFLTLIYLDRHDIYRETIGLFFLHRHSEHPEWPLQASANLQKGFPLLVTFGYFIACHKHARW
jgi:hypothetical protein